MDQYFDSQPVRAAILGMYGMRRQDTEIPLGKRLWILVNILDAAAREDINKLEICMRVRWYFQAGLFQEDNIMFRAGNNLINIPHDVQYMVPGEQRDVPGITIYG